MPCTGPALEENDIYQAAESGDLGIEVGGGDG